MFEEIIRAKQEVGTYVKKRLEEFRSLRERGRTVFDFRPFVDISYEADIFSELCFCLLTANSSALLGIRAQKDIGTEGFKSMSFEELLRVLSSLGHRFAHQRAERILKARESFSRVMELLSNNSADGKNVRDLLSDTCSKYKVEGFGLKEASHFLRNIGFEDVAIVDRHVFRYLKERGLIGDYKTLTRRIYLEAESKLQAICNELNLSQGELDLYIFYLKTGKVLK